MNHHAHPLVPPVTYLLESMGCLNMGNIWSPILPNKTSFYGFKSALWLVGFVTALLIQTSIYMASLDPGLCK